LCRQAGDIVLSPMKRRGQAGVHAVNNPP